MCNRKQFLVPTQLLKTLTCEQHQMSNYMLPSEAYPLITEGYKERLLAFYGGKHYSHLPTPALVLKKDVVDRNIVALFRSFGEISQQVGKKVRYRAHIKTHKTIEGTLKQLGYNLDNYDGEKYSSIVVSTLREAYLITDYQDATGLNIVKDMAYGLPACVPDVIPQLYELSKKVEKFTIFIDNVHHIEYLENFAKSLADRTFKWSVFIKIDCGTHRAGIYGEEDLSVLLKTLLSIGKHIDLFGFYAHAGHSYGTNTIHESEQVLLEEITYVNDACKTLLKICPSFPVSHLVLSVGASPTARSFQKSKNPALLKCVKGILGTLELHAGNFLISDLQQLATGTIEEKDISAFILGTVISTYPGRNTEIGELLTNTGVLSMTKETSHKFPGYGVVTNGNYGRWYLQRLSQEHGIMQPLEDSCKLIPLGTKIEILMQHVCINMACFAHFFVINDEGYINDVWIPCRGW